MYFRDRVCLKLMFIDYICIYFYNDFLKEIFIVKFWNVYFSILCSKNFGSSLIFGKGD